MKVNFEFKPAIVKCLKNYSKEKFISDVMAGLIVGIVALPLAIAFGIASGVSPEKGLITAIIGGFLISFFGGSSVQIGGPTGSIIVVAYGLMQTFGAEGLAIATIMAGIMLILMGVCKLGTIIRFIPYPVVIGFTSGIALTIFTTQIKDLFGLTMDEVPADFISKWIAYIENIGSLDLWTLGISIFTILIIAYTPRISKKIPGSLIAIIVMTLVAFGAKQYLGVESIETIGSLTASLPMPKGVNFDLSLVRALISPAFTIAMMIAIESLLSATVSDGIVGEKHDSNTELIAEGFANVVVPFFGGIPVTGVIARTMTNINNGGNSPISGIMHSITLLLILLFLGPLTMHIPMACLAGVLVIVSYNMSEWRTIRSLCKNPNTDVAVLFTTMLLTVIFDLSIAIEIGMLLATLLFLRRMTENTQVSVERHHLDIHEETDYALDADDHLDLEEGVEVYEIDGPFFFGVANKFDETMRIIGDKPLVRIIRMRKVPFIDTTGLHNLEILITSSKSEDIQIILSGVRPEVKSVLLKSNIDKRLGENRVFDHINKAVVKANEIAIELKNKQ